MEEQIPTVDELRSRWENTRKEADEAAVKAGRAPEDVKIIAVSKMKPAAMLVAAARAGIKVFGENYAQEMKDKYAEVSQEITEHIEWHFIGHLQTNKVKYIAPFATMIHSVDSFHLAAEIDRQAEKNIRSIDILLQVNTSGEHSKSGCEPSEVSMLATEVMVLKNIRIRGLMTIGSFTDDEVLIRKEFRILSSLREDLKKEFPDIGWEHLSMGMSGDFPIAIEEGATMVRIGTAIFGHRNYGNR